MPYIARGVRAILEARELAKDDPIRQRLATFLTFFNSISQFPSLIRKENLAKFEAVEVEIGGEPGVYAYMRIGGWVASYVGPVLDPVGVRVRAFIHVRASAHTRTNYTRLYSARRRIDGLRASRRRACAQDFRVPLRACPYLMSIPTIPTIAHSQN